jgi:hypothetical protein
MFWRRLTSGTPSWVAWDRETKEVILFFDFISSTLLPLFRESAVVQSSETVKLVLF